MDTIRIATMADGGLIPFGFCFSCFRWLASAAPIIGWGRTYWMYFFLSKGGFCLPNEICTGLSRCLETRSQLSVAKRIIMKQWNAQRTIEVTGIIIVLSLRVQLDRSDMFLRVRADSLSLKFKDFIINDRSAAVEHSEWQQQSTWFNCLKSCWGSCVRFVLRVFTHRQIKIYDFSITSLTTGS